MDKYIVDSWGTTSQLVTKSFTITLTGDEEVEFYFSNRGNWEVATIPFEAFKQFFIDHIDLMRKKG